MALYAKSHTPFTEKNSRYLKIRAIVTFTFTITQGCLVHARLSIVTAVGDFINKRRGTGTFCAIKLFAFHSFRFFIYNEFNSLEVLGHIIISRSFYRHRNIFNASEFQMCLRTANCFDFVLSRQKNLSLFL